MKFAGIGSRQTPSGILLVAIDVCKDFAERGYLLRSGGAEGFDSAAERGCDLGNGKKEIYLPWKGFRNNKSDIFGVDSYAMTIAKEFHPAWDKLTPEGQLLISRNSYQILGPELDDPVDFVFCWTPDGELRGGTAQGLRIAKKYDIPIFNLGDKDLTIEKIYSSIDLLCQFS